MSRACRECGCTEGRACFEFDREGYAHACYWAASDLCSACMFDVYVEPPEADEGIDTRLAVNLGKRKRGFLHVPQLAGMVAQHREPLTSIPFMGGEIIITPEQGRMLQEQQARIEGVRRRLKGGRR